MKKQEDILELNQQKKFNQKDLNLYDLLVGEDFKGAPGLCCGLCVIYLRLAKEKKEETLLTYLNSRIGEGELQATVMRITTSKNWINEFKEVISPLGLKIHHSIWKEASGDKPVEILKWIAQCPMGMIVLYGGAYSHALGIIQRGGIIYLFEPNKGFYLFPNADIFVKWVQAQIELNPQIATCMLFSIS